MSKNQTRKDELTPLLAGWRNYAAANPNDANAAATVRQLESELAQVNTQLNFGPGAPGVIGAAIGRATIAQHRPRMARDTNPTPAPLPTAQPAPPRPSFVAESDVPYPTPTANLAAQIVRENGRRQVAPLTQPAAPPQAPTAAPDPPPAAPCYGWQRGDDVAVPAPDLQGNAPLIRRNGQR